MTYEERSARRHEMVWAFIAIVLGLIILFGRAEAVERTVLSLDGDVYITTWDECEDCEDPDKAVIYDENGKCRCVDTSPWVQVIPYEDAPKSTYSLPFPDGTTWTEGQPSPWVKREEFDALKARVEKLEQDKLPHIELCTEEKMVEANPTCPKCGAKMVKRYQNMVLTSIPPQYPWNWWCGCGYIGPQETDRGTTYGDTTLQEWEELNKKGEK